MGEETRAKLWRVQQRNRRRYRRIVNRRLRGDRAQGRAVRDDWKPITTKDD